MENPLLYVEEPYDFMNNIQVKKVIEIDEYHSYCLDNKIVKNKNLITIGTHSGKYHADEIAACTMLALYENLRAYVKKEDKKKIIIFRTRNQAVYDELDYVVDVGRVHNHVKKKYDHHQSGFEMKFSTKHSTTLSSIGLIWYYYGKDIIKMIIQVSIEKKSTEKYQNHFFPILNDNDDAINFIHEFFYNEYIEELDADDNGVDLIKAENLPSVITGGNGFITTVKRSYFEKPFLPGFPKVKDIESIFKYFISQYLFNFFSGIDYVFYIENKKDYIIDVFTNSENMMFDGKVIILDKKYVWEPFQDIIEKKNGKKLVYIVFKGFDKKYHAYSVPKRKFLFESKKPFPIEWRGLSSNELNKIIGVNDMVMVHNTGFLAISESKETIIKVIEISLKS